MSYQLEDEEEQLYQSSKKRNQVNYESSNPCRDCYK